MPGFTSAIDLLAGRLERREVLRRMALAVAGSGLAPRARATADADALAALYPAARAEGQLVLYGGGPAANYEPLARAFERQYLGITVSISGGFSNVLNQQIESQLSAGKLAVDLAIFQTVQDFIGWKRRGLLASFQPTGIEAVHPAFRDADGAWVALYASTLSYAYNTRLVAPADIPRSALDFLHPRFRGQVIAAYPQDDDATLYLFETLVARHGWGWMERFVQNEPVFVQGHLGVARAIAAGTSLVSFDATVSTVGSLKAAGQPIDFAFPAEDPMPVFTVSAGIFRDAPHPAAARLYLSWLLQPAQQARSPLFSTRNDVPSPAGLAPLLSYRLANDYVGFVSDAARLRERRARYEQLIGPVRNAGGVR
jgi:ABC-type Fe3+ transport system substrate-binding protein